MSTDQQTPKDEMLWKLAKKRAHFKRTLISYIIINLFLWALWYFTGDDREFTRHNFPWPLWVTIGWGIALAFQYSDAYLFPGHNSAEKEYEKLKNKQ